MSGEMPILTYHSLDASGSVVSVEPGTFAAQMAAIAESGWQGISLREALAARETTGTWPQRSVVLTFDDGYANVHAQALPVLARHGFTATLFLVTGHVNGSNDWAPPPIGLGVRRMLTWTQVQELNAARWEIGAHTHRHPDLWALAPAAVQEEIVTSGAVIAQQLGRRTESFAYPYGFATEPARRVVRREFRAACSTVLRIARDEPLDCLPRIDVYYFRSPLRMRWLLNGRIASYLTLLRWSRAVRHALHR